MTLVSGRGDDLDHPPGRDLLVPSSAMLADLAHAIDVAFGRWDLGHGHEFTLPDGRHASDLDDDSPDDAIDPKSATIDSLRLGQGDRFRYVFDLGDEWTHECVVLRSPAEPAAAAHEIIPVHGWGVIPDQYGRVRPDDDSDAGPAEDPEPRS